MSDSLKDRIIMRRKFAEHYQDRKLFNEILGVLEDIEAAEDPSPLQLDREAGEEPSDAFTRITGIKLMNWQVDRLNEGEW